MQRKQNGGVGLGRDRFVMAVGVAGVALAAALHGVAAPVVTTAVYGPGDFDPDFGNGGFASLQIADYGGQTKGVAIGAGGTILTTGFVTTRPFGADGATFVARFNADGSAETSFGGSGYVVTSLVNTNTGGASNNALVMQSDGKTISVGSHWSGQATKSAWHLVRYNANGSLDTKFGSKGITKTDWGTTTPDVAFDVALDASGRAVVVGSGGGGLAVARYGTNGKLDTTFDGDGKRVLSGGAGNGVTIQDDGRILVVGTSTAGDLLVARLNTNGSLDASFGAGGIVTMDLVPSGVTGGTNGTNVLIQTDGRIVATGYVGGMVGEYDYAVAFAVRLLSDGAPDSSFGTNGVWLDDESYPIIGYAEWWSSALQPDGKIVIGSRHALGNSGGLVKRLTASGSIDSTFGDSGTVQGLPGHKIHLVTQLNGSIVGATAAQSLPEEVMLFQLLVDDPALLIAPNPISSTGNVALAVGATHGLNGAIQGVDFWVDVDGDAALDDAIDQFLAAGTYNSTLDVWETGGPNPAPVGTATFFAVTHYAGGDTVVAQQAEVVP